MIYIVLLAPNENDISAQQKLLCDIQSKSKSYQ